MTRLIASFFWIGFLRPAPGTWGSLAALPVAWALHLIGGAALLAVASLAVFFLGLHATRAETATGEDPGGDHDPSWIVIDEVVGMWIALLPVSFGANMMGLDVLALYPGVISAFVFFRLFDIWKPWIVGRADRLGTPMGVMLDDVWAGVLAAIATSGLAALAHGVLM